MSEKTEKKSKRNIYFSQFKVFVVAFLGLIFSMIFMSLNNIVFAANFYDRVIPAYKLYVLPIHKYIYINTLGLAKYKNLNHVFLQKRYPGLDREIIKDLGKAYGHPSLWLNGTLFKGTKNSLNISIMQVMTRDRTFPNTVGLKYDIKDTPWHIQRLRTFQFLMTPEAIKEGRIKTRPIYPYPIHCHEEINNYLGKNGFKTGHGISNPTFHGKLIEDESSEEDLCSTPYLENICTISQNKEEMEGDIQNNGIVVVKNILINEFKDD